jgi:hypothetical protein
MIREYVDESLTIHMEDTEVGWFIHLDCHDWKLSTMKKCYIIIEQLIDKYGDIRAPIEDTDVRLQKFASMYGFVETDMTSIHADGKIRRIWICHKLYPLSK